MIKRTNRVVVLLDAEEFRALKFSCAITKESQTEFTRTAMLEKIKGVIDLDYAKGMGVKK